MRQFEIVSSPVTQQIINDISIDNGIPSFSNPFTVIYTTEDQEYTVDTFSSEDQMKNHIYDLIENKMGPSDNWTIFGVYSFNTPINLTVSVSITI
ncbi:hypothetical protein [Evansella clarkii]|uniref:hypothetical protein n=1 Tax=Evansella clarkii TaxID=79879 RepID=UPI0009971021|nr:hypothetical protein [Evansella clarkii]